MSDTNLGIDLALDGLGDLILGDNGDFINTQDVEQIDPSLYSFTGQYNISISLLNRLMTIPGDYQFDNTFGSNIPAQISSTDLSVQNTIKDIVTEALLEDTRVKDVVSVKSSIDGNKLNIMVKLFLIGSNTISTLVFPDIYLEQ